MKKYIALALAICGLSAPLSALEVFDNGKKLIIGTFDSDRLKYKGSDADYTKDLNEAVDSIKKIDEIEAIAITDYSFESIENIDKFFAKFENLKSLEIGAQMAGQALAEKLCKLDTVAKKITSFTLLVLDDFADEKAESFCDVVVDKFSNLKVLTVFFRMETSASSLNFRTKKELLTKNKNLKINLVPNIYTESDLSYGNEGIKKYFFTFDFWNK
jgi:hypothetical protein